MSIAWRLRNPGDWTVVGLSVPDLAIGALLSAVPVAVAVGAVADGGKHPGVPACLGVVALTLPVAWRRPLPLTAAAVMAIGAVVNGLAFGPLVRCGVALPAVLIVAFGIGAHCDRRRAAYGLALCAIDVVAEGYYDPQIGWSGLVFVGPLLLAFFVLGRLVSARNRTARALRATSAQLRRQREETARLAVQAARARLSADIEGSLHDQLAVIADTAAAGLSREAAADPSAATRALAAIERDGRAALGQLRDVVGNLSQPDRQGASLSAEPQPTLARLPELFAGLPPARARLTVEGQPRPLAAALELSGYRIVEHLVEALRDESSAVIEVLLRYDPEALELRIRGMAAPGTDLQAVLGMARQRAVLHGGTVDGQVAGRACFAIARLPLVSGYA